MKLHSFKDYRYFVVTVSGLVLTDRDMGRGSILIRTNALKEDVYYYDVQVNYFRMLATLDDLDTVLEGDPTVLRCSEISGGYANKLLPARKLMR
jgi:hypothetical protein